MFELSGVKLTSNAVISNSMEKQNVREAARDILNSKMSKVFSCDINMDRNI